LFVAKFTDDFERDTLAQVEERGNGQQHHLCLLSVLLMQPQSFLLDEPFAGLDLPTPIHLTRRLAALPEWLITITHDPASVASYDRVLWLDQGKICAGVPSELTLTAFHAEMSQLGERNADTHLSD
jgi:biotin transport system ATP-binding protein